jgi:hypothetical protein
MQEGKFMVSWFPYEKFSVHITFDQYTIHSFLN